MTEVVFLVTLPSGVHIDDDVLAEPWTAQILDRPGRLLLPLVSGVESEREFSHLDPPGGCAIAPPEQPATWPMDSWGIVFNVLTSTGRRLVELRRLAVSAMYSGSDDEGERRAFADAMRHGVEHWVARLCRWLEVAAGTVLGDPQAAPEPLQVDVYHVSLTPGGSGMIVFEPLSQIIHAGTIQWWRGAFNRRQWDHAVAKASDGVDPPLFHSYLHDARLAVRRNDWRRSVVDAATACELALSSSIRGLRAGDRSGDVESVLKSLNGLVSLYDYRDALSPIGSVSRRRLSFELANTRNEVVHQGREATEADSDRAIRVAADLIGEVAPVLAD